MFNNGDNMIIVLQPTFSNRFDKDDYPIEVEFGDLPSSVRKEVLEFFKSDEFITDQAQNYALNEITAGHLTYPEFDTIINKVVFNLHNKILYVYLYGTLVEVTKEKDNLYYKPVTIKEYGENVKEGFHKASHSGPLTSKYGNHLGEDEGRYSIYLNYDRINSFLKN